MTTTATTTCPFTAPPVTASEALHDAWRIARVRWQEERHAHLIRDGLDDATPAAIQWATDAVVQAERRMDLAITHYFGVLRQHATT